MTDRELLHWVWEELEDLADVGYGSKTLLEALRDRLAQPAPQKKQWVGLTHEELAWLNEALNLGGRFAVIEAIEAKLKEKNT
jgi:hypothetical protein